MGFWYCMSFDTTDRMKYIYVVSFIIYMHVNKFTIQDEYDKEDLILVIQMQFALVLCGCSSWMVVSSIWK